jgi:alpha-L-fucosidase
MMCRSRSGSAVALAALLALGVSRALAAEPGNGATAKDKATVSAEHGMIDASEDKSNATHTTHPDAQWYPSAGFGMFIHWGVASVSARNISWSMIPGRVLAKRQLDPAELARVVRERDWNLTGTPPELTPNEYWADAEHFNPQNYDPDKWCAAAKAAGFEYMVLTTKHHEGFALWPSAYGNFNTRNYMGGRDLVKEYVEACRKHGLKVGLYFSGPDWHFDRDYMSFIYGGGRKKNPGLPSVDADLNVRTTHHTEGEIKQHQAEFAKLVKGQITELLTRYGKIDLLWFDGKPAIPNATEVMTIDEIRKLQPGIVINPRLHGHGDFVTFERTMPDKKPNPASWAELCNPWTGAWPYTKGEKYRSDAYVLGQLAECRSKGINYLLGIGPMASGELAPAAYEHMAHVADWMKRNGPSVHAVTPLPAGETASVPATAAGNVRYLYAMPVFAHGGTSDADLQPPTAVTMTLRGASKPQSVTLLGDGRELRFTYSGDALTIDLPVDRRTKLVDVVRVALAK